MAKKKPPKDITVLPKEPKKMGRPSLYTDAIAAEICERISQGQLLIRIAELDHMPDYSTISKWIVNKEEFFAMYARARASQADRFAEECIEMADEAHDGESSSAQRLKVDTRKWYTAKIRPRFYGENGTGFDIPDKAGGIDSLRQLAENLVKLAKGPIKGPDSDEGGK